MPSKKPLVLDVGTIRELINGETLTGVGVFPFYESDGTPAPINLTADGDLPFFLSDGSPSDIPILAVDPGQVSYVPVPFVQAESPSSGDTVLMVALKRNGTLFLTPAATLATLTINVPDEADSLIGETRLIYTSEEITALTVANATTIVVPASMDAMSSIKIQKMAANDWRSIT